MVGIAHDGALNLREGPGLKPVLATLHAGDRVVAEGAGIALATTTWWKIEAYGTTGWVNASYLAIPVAARTPLTEDVESVHGGPLVAGSLGELGQMIAETLVNGDYDSRLALAQTPLQTVGRVDAQYDIVSEETLGLTYVRRGLDGQVGWRLYVTVDTLSGRYRLVSVDGQALLHACTC